MCVMGKMDLVKQVGSSFSTEMTLMIMQIILHWKLPRGC